MTWTPDDEAVKRALETWQLGRYKDAPARENMRAAIVAAVGEQMEALDRGFAAAIDGQCELEREVKTLRDERELWEAKRLEVTWEPSEGAVSHALAQWIGEGWDAETNDSDRAAMSLAIVSAVGELIETLYSECDGLRAELDLVKRERAAADLKAILATAELERVKRELGCPSCCDDCEGATGGVCKRHQRYRQPENPEW